MRNRLYRAECKTVIEGLINEGVKVESTYWRNDPRCRTNKKMEEAVRKAKTISYQRDTDISPKEFDRVQILTAYEIIEGARMDCPPTMQVVRNFREAKAQLEMQV